MFRKLIKNKKAQNTAEYAILISLVVAAVIAMQTYAQRTLQARIRDASQYMVNQTSNSSIGLGSTGQYEPYYLSTAYNVIRNEDETQVLGTNTTTQLVNTIRTRQSAGFQQSTYNGFNLINGI